MIPDLQIVMPVHNEAAGIGPTLKEWYDELSPAKTLPKKCSSSWPPATQSCWT